MPTSHMTMVLVYTKKQHSLILTKTKSQHYFSTSFIMEIGIKKHLMLMEDILNNWSPIACFNLEMGCQSPVVFLAIITV